MLIRSKLSKTKQRELLKFFVAEAPARVAAELTDVHVNSATLFFHKIRQEIERHHSEAPCEDPSISAIAIDPTSLCQHKEEIPLLAIYLCKDRIAATLIANLENPSLLPYNELYRQPQGLIFIERKSSYTHIHASNLRFQRLLPPSATARHPIGPVENFWHHSEEMFLRYNQMTIGNFNLFLQEAIFRFNTPSPSAQLKALQEWIYL